MFTTCLYFSLCNQNNLIIINITNCCDCRQYIPTYIFLLGLKINLHKCNLMNVGISNKEVDQCASIMGCLSVRFHFTYLARIYGGVNHGPCIELMGGGLFWCSS